MKTILALLLASFAACLLLPACAQDLPPDVVVTASNSADPLTAQVIELAVQFPWVVGVLSFVGALRVIFKPGMAIIRWIVGQTDSKKDDEVLEQVERHPIFAALDWFLDLITSIKTDVVKSAVQSRGSRAALMVPFILAGVLLQFAVGCSTTGGVQPLTPERVQKISRLAVWSTASLMISKKPEREVAFRKAKAALDKLVTEQNWQVDAIAAALASSGEKMFSGSEGRLILSGTALAIDTLAGETVDLRRPEFIRAVLLGAQDGLSLALEN